MILVVVYTVCMIMWLFGGGYVANQGGSFNFSNFGGGTLLPWVCVAILGWKMFGG